MALLSYPFAYLTIHYPHEVKLINLENPDLIKISFSFLQTGTYIKTVFEQILITY